MKKANPMSGTRITFAITPEKLEQFGTKCSKERRSMSEVLRVLVDNWIENEEAEK